MAVGPHMLTGELKGTHVWIPNSSACIYHTKGRQPLCRHRNSIHTEGLPFTETTTDFLASVHTRLQTWQTFSASHLEKEYTPTGGLHAKLSRFCLHCRRTPHLTYSKTTSPKHPRHHVTYNYVWPMNSTTLICKLSIATSPYSARLPFLTMLSMHSTCTQTEQHHQLNNIPLKTCIHNIFTKHSSWHFQLVQNSFWHNIS